MSALPPFPEVRHEVGEAAIAVYAELSGDYNPLHVDAEYAAASPFGGIVAHGPIGLQTVFEAVALWLQSDGIPVGVTIDVAFRGPVRIDSTVVCRATGVVEHAGIALVLVSCAVADSEVLQAIVSVPKRLIPAPVA